MVVRALGLFRLGLAAGMNVGKCLMKVPNESGGLMAEILFRKASILFARRRQSERWMFVICTCPNSGTSLI